jgi:hypothetical protein
MVAILLLVVALLLAGLVLLRRGDRPTEPVDPPVPVPPLAKVAQEYWVEADGTVTIDEMVVAGRVRMHYLVHPDGRVVAPALIAWIDDVDLVVSFLWWEVEREPLRCTSFRNLAALEGTLDGEELVIPPGAELTGVSYLEKHDGRCEGEARQIVAETTEQIVATHDPAGDRFALATSFEAGEEGQEVTVTIDVEGGYLNRPPVAVLAFAAEGVPLDSDGCPMDRKKDPPSPATVFANTAQGLEVMLHSHSHDPDGVWPGGQVPKGLRVDLAFEQWARTREGAFSFLGEGPDLGPVLFETGREHQLLLWVTDRRGAEARKVCRFRVVGEGGSR